MKWEYLLKQISLEKEEYDPNYYHRSLDGWGADGWELVSVVVVENQYHFFFKKPVS